MNPPQTLKLKTKLSLDIPSSYSDTDSQINTGSSISPSFSPFSTSSPSSPMFSSNADLRSLLKDAYGVIREREKDLMLAAEIGKSLIDKNIELKSKYESAIVQIQHLQRAGSKAATFTTHQIGDKNATPIASPNNSLETFVEEPEEFEESDTESLQGWSISFDLQSDETPFKQKNRDQNSDLEMRNQEAYTMATQKIEDLEKENETLLHKIQELKEQNDLVEITKLQVEQQIARSSSEMKAIKEEYEELEGRLKKYEILLTDNHEKDNLIAELIKSLAEQRASLVWLQEASPVNFVSEVFDTSLEGFRLLFETSLMGFRKQLGV